jgi:hypothetical protein
MPCVQAGRVREREPGKSIVHRRNSLPEGAPAGFREIDPVRAV